MSVSNYLESRWLNTLRNVSGAIANVYASLHSADPGETGANEITGGSYARQAITLTDPTTTNTCENSAQITFPSLPATDVVAMGLWDAVSAGNCLFTGWNGNFVFRPFTSTTADVITSPAHGYADGDRVVFDAEDIGSLPTGITAGTIYFVRDSTTDTFKIAATNGGAAIDLTTVGSGKVRKVTVQTVAAGTNFVVAAGDIDLFVF